MDQTAKLKVGDTVAKQENEEYLYGTVKAINLDKNTAQIHFEGYPKDMFFWYPIGDVNVVDENKLMNQSMNKLKEAFKAEIRKTIKEIQDINELARVANTIKISNGEAAKAYVAANKGKWVADMVQAVIDAGKTGITQPALATAIGKGSQQTINPKVRELLAAGVFSQGEGAIKQAAPSQEKPKAEPKPLKPVSSKSDDEDEEEYTDDFEEADLEDAPEDEDALAAKATPNKGVQTDAKKLDAVLKQMKELAAEFKIKKGTSDGDAIVAKLKDLNKERSRLEKIVHKALGSDDEDLLDTGEND